MRLAMIKVADCKPGPSLRIELDPHSLIASLLEIGPQKPIRVAKMGDYYVVHQGIRRLEAYKCLGWTQIAAEIMEPISVEEQIRYAIN